jgi:hypothetical protein
VREAVMRVARERGIALDASEVNVEDVGVPGRPAFEVSAEHACQVSFFGQAWAREFEVSSAKK